MLLLGKFQKGFQRFGDKGGTGVLRLFQKIVHAGILIGGTTECNGFEIHSIGILAYFIQLFPESLVVILLMIERYANRWCITA